MGRSVPGSLWPPPGVSQEAQSIWGHPGSLGSTCMQSPRGRASSPDWVGKSVSAGLRVPVVTQV